MFIVASDLGEAQRERLTSSLSLQRNKCHNLHPWESENSVNGTVLYAEKFNGESFTPSERTHGGITNRTFIVENYAEDDFGQWAMDQVTGEQGYIDDERSCFWTLDNNEYTWQSRPFKSRQVRKKKAKEKAKVDIKKKEHSLVKNKHRTLNGGPKKIVLGGPKEKEARKVLRKAMKAFRKVIFALTNQNKVRHKGRGKDEKGKGKEGAYP